MLQLGAKVCICAVVRGVLLAKKVIMVKKCSMCFVVPLPNITFDKK